MDTLNNMRIFTRVVDAGGFTAAARQLNATTAQVSRAVSDLETHLRTRLLNRTTRRLAVTEAGQRYLQRCAHILAIVDEAEAEAADANVVASGTLRIHAMTSFGQRYLIPAIARYREAHPAVAVELTLSQRIPDLIDEGYDTAVALSGGLPDSGMISQRLGSVYSVLCASPGYLRAHGTPSTPEALAGHPCLQLQGPFFPLDRWTFEPLPDGGAGPACSIDVSMSSFRVNVAEALDQAIREGMGIGMLPSYAALDGLRDGSLVRLFAHYRLQRFEIHALYSSRQYIDAKIRTWVDFLSARLPLAMGEDDAVLAEIARR
ncbi:LysR family transcriptional regulator [Robbsia sp. Bb-Pol-6]|uniref:LysR family transcriptional regulator n=1 Tax=Robbsia betulipollinis TaxID=2981849 RepID=A0ABT3ZNB4_9BURK|nr:LysR family transcriptional regulator [Robbsia betulipollinis]